MDENAHLRQRTDEILRERIALGLTGGLAYAPRLKRTRKTNRRKCPKGSEVRCKDVGCFKRTAKGKKKVAKRKPAKRAKKGKGYDDGGVMAGGCEECPMCQGSGLLIGGITAGKRKARKSGSKTQKVTRRKTTRASTSPWIRFLKAYAKDNGITYGEAIRDPKASRQYHAMGY